MSIKSSWNKIERRFDQWLEEFENRPIKTGIKIIIIVVILRWIFGAVVGGDE